MTKLANHGTPFDNTLRFLQKLSPVSYAKLLGLNARRIRYCDTNLSTVTSMADCVLMIGGQPFAEHVENQASYDATIDMRSLVYNVLARKSLGVPVNTTVILLRPEADGPAMNGILRCHGRCGIQNLEFRFDVVRLWTIPAERLFKCGIGVLPLAFAADIKEEQLPEFIARAKQVLKRRHVKRKDVGEVWTSIKVLMGLRFDEPIINRSLLGIKGMKESVGYQAILREGEAKGKAEGIVIGERRILLRNATRKFGVPKARVLKAINAVESLQRLEELNDRALLVSSWEELLKS